MHPDDQFEAFRTLIEDKGASVEEVAAPHPVAQAMQELRATLAAIRRAADYDSRG
jgi:hypothetical protein